MLEMAEVRDSATVEFKGWYFESQLDLNIQRVYGVRVAQFVMDAIRGLPGYGEWGRRKLGLYGGFADNFDLPHMSSGRRLVELVGGDLFRIMMDAWDCFPVGIEDEEVDMGDCRGAFRSIWGYDGESVLEEYLNRFPPMRRMKSLYIRALRYRYDLMWW
jgi:hypothetical protein